MQARPFDLRQRVSNRNNLQSSDSKFEKSVTQGDFSDSAANGVCEWLAGKRFASNRGKYTRAELCYPSDLMGGEWELIDPLIWPAKYAACRHEVVNGLAYALNTGCPFPLLLAKQHQTQTPYDAIHKAARGPDLQTVQSPRRWLQLAMTRQQSAPSRHPISHTPAVGFARVPPSKPQISGSDSYRHS